MKTTSVTVQSPASIANLVCGFDVLGMCLQEPYDEITVKLITERKVIIHNDSSFDLPLEQELNTAGMPLLEMLKILDENIGFEDSIKKSVRPGSGLGSSA